MFHFICIKNIVMLKKDKGRERPEKKMFWKNKELRLLMSFTAEHCQRLKKQKFFHFFLETNF